MDVRAKAHTHSLSHTHTHTHTHTGARPVIKAQSLRDAATRGSLCSWPGPLFKKRRPDGLARGVTDRQTFSAWLWSLSIKLCGSQGFIQSQRKSWPVPFSQFWAPPFFVRRSSLVTGTYTISLERGGGGGGRDGRTADWYGSEQKGAIQQKCRTFCSTDKCQRRIGLRKRQRGRQNLFMLDDWLEQSPENTKHWTHFRSASQSFARTPTPKPHCCEKWCIKNIYSLSKRPYIVLKDGWETEPRLSLSHLWLEYKARPDWLWGHDTNFRTEAYAL